MGAILDLLENYSITSILTFSIMLALAVKGFVDFFDWAKARIRKSVDEKNNEENREQTIEVKIQDLEQHQKDIYERLDNLCGSIQLLLDSDRDDIKSWITEKHHYYCYEKKHIDDFALECVEKRYKHYKDEGGNSFIDQMMQDIRSLPRVLKSEKMKQKYNNK